MTTKAANRLVSEIEAGGLKPAEGNSFDPVRTAATLVSAAVIIAALYFGRDILIPLAFAFLIGFALNPPVNWLRRRGVPKIAAVAAVMTIVLVLLAGLVLMLGSQVRSLSEQLPTYQSTIQKKLSDLRAELKAPGIFDGALRTVDLVQKEVEPAKDAGPPAQRVEVVPAPGSQIETALVWVGRAVEPLATFGIILIFVVLALLDRADLRDRLLRIFGGNLHRSTDAIEEAGKRISKYLMMQLIVNITYGIPLTIGLWLIGVPGALLWGALAAVMRFVPYLGPLISAIFPLALAFAVDPGWNMVLWTVALILGLELISNNVVEPLLYGSSTGLSAISLIAAATFWTALWGPIGLILSTPLTVCLLVIGKNLPQLQFFDTLLGSVPVLDPPTRLYQRLLANDVEEAVDIAEEQAEKSSVVEFYDQIGIRVLRLASDDYALNATAEHRLRVSDGMNALLGELEEENPVPPGAGGPKVVCLGGKWEIDAIAARMLAHALSMAGIPAESRPVVQASAMGFARLDLDDASAVCVSYFSDQPESAARQFCRRLRRRWPHLKIVLALWNQPSETLVKETYSELGADEVATSINEAVGRMQRLLPITAPDPAVVAPPERDDERVAALHRTDFLNPALRDELDAIAKRAADAFDVSHAMVSAVDADHEVIIGQNGVLAGFARDDADRTTLPRSEAVCNHVVASGETLIVPDTERDPRFSDNPAIAKWQARFYAGAPLLSADGLVLGALCILDTDPRELTERELELLEKLASDAVGIITAKEQAAEPQEREPDKDAPSATVGQNVPH
jgi:predicted PurR-regulated permease PerM